MIKRKLDEIVLIMNSGKYECYKEKYKKKISKKGTQTEPEMVKSIKILNAQKQKRAVEFSLSCLLLQNIYKELIACE